MPKKSSFFKIGLFAVSAFFLLGAGIIFFGLSSIFQPTLECDTYFDHSVQGLSTGSAVNFRGFKVGQVSSISVSKLETEQGKQKVRVVFILFPQLLTGSKAGYWEARNYLEKEINSGLRVFMSFQGISGVSFLDLDYLSSDLSAELSAPSEM
jgi:paraquat-inducible protein B